MSQIFAASLLVALIATPTLAREPAPAASQQLGGAPVTGVCLLSKQAVLANAKVALAADARLRQLTAQAQAALDAERAAIEADTKSLDAQKASMKAADVQQKRSALAVRIRALQQKTALRSRQVEATREKVLAQISVQAQPLIAQAYQAHNCGLLVDRNAVLGGNMSNDLTAEVVSGLDAKITTINFELEPLPTQATR